MSADSREIAGIMKTNIMIAHGGGPTAVMNASLAGAVSAAKRDPRVGRVLSARHGIEGVLAGNVIDLTDLSEADLTGLARTPASAIGSCRYKVQEDDYQRILGTLRQLEVGVFLYNGGNDSMDTCLQVSSLTDDIRVIGIPKTIDNDLCGTDHSPGFGSAARFFALSALELSLDVAALNIHVSILEVMGRNAGWLTAASGLAHEIGGVGPEMLLVPEHGFDEERFLDETLSRWNRERGFVVAVSEGLTSSAGKPLVHDTSSAAVDAFGHTLPGNVSQYLASLVSSRLGIRARSEKPGLLGRASAATVSPTDREEAFAVGDFAVRSALDGESGKMVAISRVQQTPYKWQLSLTELEQSANAERLLPEEYLDRDLLRITPAFCDYAMPLLGTSLPDYFRLP